MNYKQKLKEEKILKQLAEKSFKRKREKELYTSKLMAFWCFVLAITFIALRMVFA